MLSPAKGPMFDRLDPEAVLLEHLSWVEEVAAIVCRRNSVWGDDADDFASSAKSKLMANGYAAIRKFRGESALKTYLARVVVFHFCEWMRERNGRWRPSTIAEAHGQLAKDLEAMVYRDGCRLAEAGERLRTAGRTSASDGELARLLARLPRRTAVRQTQAGEAPLEDLPAHGGADDTLEDDEAEVARARVMSALHAALDQLSPEDHMVVRMHLADGRSVAHAARALSLDQKALYKRLPKLRALLRARIEGAGVSAADVRETLDRGSPYDITE
jgi:RNA polymerase sigma factor for flagellar operon FliA